MLTMLKFPVEIHASNTDAAEQGSILTHVFDIESLRAVFLALSKTHLHVISYDVEGTILGTYDNR